jgi:hypothetical protein
MTLTLLWIVPAIALLAGGWFASAWFHQRKIDALHGQVKAVRQTAAEHANQVRRQIGQLQAELAARPPATPAQREARAAAPAPAPTPASVAATAAAAAVARRAAAEALVPDHGFAATAIAGNGFATTQVME